VFKRLALLVSLIILIGVVISAYRIRIISYDTIPAFVHLDEIDYAWAGISLRHTGIPIGWSAFSEIPRDDGLKIGGVISGFTIRENTQLVNSKNFSQFAKPVYAVSQLDYGLGLRHIQFMAPFLDHPPLGGLILSLNIGQETQTFSQVNVSQTRSVAQVLAIITTFQIFILCLIFTRSPFMAILAVAIYSFVPTYLLASRMSFLENVSSPFVLTALIFLFLSQLTLKHTRLALPLFLFSALFIGLSCLIKESSLGFILGIMAVLLSKKISKKLLLIYFLIAISPFIFYLVWGLHFSPRVFWATLLGNSGRSFFGSLNLIHTLSYLRFTSFPMDGWWVLGWFSFFFISRIKRFPVNLIAYPALGYLLVVLFFGGVNYPWYYLTLIPFLVIFSALQIYELWINPDLWSGLVFFLLPFSSSLYWGREIIQNFSHINEYRLILFIFLALLIIRLTKHHRTVIVYLWTITFFFLLLIVFKWNYQSNLYILSHWGNLPYSNSSPI